MENFKEKGDIEYLKPIVREFKVRSSSNILIAFLLGIAIILVELLGIFIFGISFADATVLAAILVLIYGTSLAFLLEPTLVREIKMTAVKKVDKPVVKVKERVVEKVVRKPVVRTVTKQVVRYREKKRKMPTPKRYKFVASQAAKLKKDKIYHPINSTAARMIRPKNRIHSNSEASLKKKGYRPSDEILSRKKEARQKAARKAARTRAENAAKKKTTKKKISKK